MEKGHFLLIFRAQSGAFILHFTPDGIRHSFQSHKEGLSGGRIHRRVRDEVIKYRNRHLRIGLRKEWSAVASEMNDLLLGVGARLIGLHDGSQKR